MSHLTAFTDNVDGTISLEDYCIRIIDTTYFQRLRELKQLGIISYVFPGAVHTRFEHSLGTAHKAYKVASTILQQQGGERAAAAGGHGVDMERGDVKLITLAGLVHDLGHGPLSHPFETCLKRLNVKHWRHENMSGRILDQLVEEYKVELDSDEVRRINDLVHGAPRDGQGWGGWGPGRRFMFDIVANKRTSVDVDKLDYIKRDASMCGVAVGCNFDRLITPSLFKVIDDRVCYHWGEYGNISNLFLARQNLHREVYTSRRCKAVELMAVDALVAANPLLRIAERAQDPKEFIGLNDSVFTLIQSYHALCRCKLDDAQENSLKAAQALVERIRKRQLYRFGNQVTVPPEFIADRRWEEMKRHFNPREVASCYGGPELPGGGGLRPGDIICDVNKIDHTMGAKNPVEEIGFFESYDSAVSFPIGQFQVVGIMPNIFQECVLRVFTPHTEQCYVDAIKEALEGWRRRYFGNRGQSATPVASRRMPGREAQEQQLLVMAAGLPQAMRQAGLAATGAAAAGTNGHLHNHHQHHPHGGPIFNLAAAAAVEVTPPRSVVPAGAGAEERGAGGPRGEGATVLGIGGRLDFDREEAEGCRGKRQRTGGQAE